MKQFKYKLWTVSTFSISDLNKFGEDGWELVSIVTLSTGGVTLYFKREL